MKLLKTAILMLIGLLILQGCSLSFLDFATNETTTENSNYPKYDSTTDTMNYYDGNDNLLWYETYDFNDLGQCILIKHHLSTDTLLWSYVYEWEGNNIVTEAYFNGSNTLLWYNVFNYSSGNMVEQVNYNGSNKLQWFKAISYSDTGRETQIAKFNGSRAMEWAYKYKYNGSDKLALISVYDSSQNQTASITYNYDSGNRIIKKTGTGSTSSADTFSAAFAGFNHPTPGGINTDIRNTAGLEAPTAPATPAIPVLTLSDQTLSYAWMSMWVYSGFGYSFVTLNIDHLPVYMKTEAPDYLNNKPIEVELTYSGSKVLTKTTSYNNLEVLKLEFEYNAAGYLASLNTTGASLYIPLRYEFAYYSPSGIPQRISIYNQSTMLQKFEYSYSGNIDSINLKDFAKSVNTISQYDGDGSPVGSYVFSYNDIDTITITVMDAENTPNGYFSLLYDGNDNAVSFTSFNREGAQVWSYKYGYDDLQNRISETRLNANDIPEVAYTFDVESIFEDLRRFLPLP